MLSGNHSSCPLLVSEVPNHRKVSATAGITGCLSEYR